MLYFYYCYYLSSSPCCDISLLPPLRYVIILSFRREGSNSKRHPSSVLLVAHPILRRHFPLFKNPFRQPEIVVCTWHQRRGAAELELHCCFSPVYRCAREWVSLMVVQISSVWFINVSNDHIWGFIVEPCQLTLVPWRGTLTLLGGFVSFVHLKGGGGRG